MAVNLLEGWRVKHRNRSNDSLVLVQGATNRGQALVDQLLNLWAVKLEVFEFLNAADPETGSRVESLPNEFTAINSISAPFEVNVVGLADVALKSVSKFFDLRIVWCAGSESFHDEGSVFSVSCEVFDGGPRDGS